MDMIDKRDQREKMVRSIIKRRNVIYGPDAGMGPAQAVQTAQPGMQPDQQGMYQPGMQPGMYQPGMQQPGMQDTAAQPSSQDKGSGNTEAMEVLARLEREAAADEAAKQAEIQRAIEQQQEKDQAISRILNEKEADRQRTMAQVRGE